MITGNKGEWSELYAFLKLLSQGCVQCVNGQLKSYPGRVHKIEKIFRDNSANRVEYLIENQTEEVLIKYEDKIERLNQIIFQDEANRLWQFIAKLKGVQENSDIEDFMHQIHTNAIKAKSTDKADIRLIIHHYAIGRTPEQGYSIKSKAGAASTLINASVDNTNFIYQVDNVTEQQILAFENETKFADKFAALRDVKFTHIGCASNILHRNLRMLDGDMEQLLSSCLLYKYRTGNTYIKDIIPVIAEEDPLNIGSDNNLRIYQYKIKQILVASALGFTPGTLWTGRFNANGGIIIVKDQGDVVCIHFYDRNDLEDYLYTQTYFETPSMTRHKFGHIYEKDGNKYLKLNLQVRFS